MINCNLQPIQIVKEIPDPISYQGFSFKNFHPKHALKFAGYEIQNIIKEMISIPSEFQHTYVDVKIQKLIPGMSTTKNRFWHLDSSLDGFWKYENYLYVTGVHALTEFMVNPLSVPEVAQINAFAFDQWVRNFDPEIERIPPRRQQGGCFSQRFSG